MGDDYEMRLIKRAQRDNGYARLAREPEHLWDVVRPMYEVFRADGCIPEWAGVDLLRGWAFYLVRAHRFSGSWAPIEEVSPAFSNSSLSLDIAMLRAPHEYRAAIAKITLALAKQPLPRLQKLPGASVSDPFLYDDSFLGENVAMRQIKAHGNAITLKPGVAFGLARLAGLLKPALEIMWVDDVRPRRRGARCGGPLVRS
jgi:hypothetical protein